MNPHRISLVIGIILAAIILLFIIGLFSSPDSDELNRQALTAEGKSITADMEQANRDHASPERVREIREREATFYNRGDDYFAKHHMSPPPRP
jgi:hypothetical protein